MSSKLVKILKLYIHLCLITLTGFLLTDRAQPKSKKYKQYDRFVQDMKYVLLWSDIESIQGNGQTDFIKKKCQFKNCYVTNNKALLGDTRVFDMILFNVVDVSKDQQPIPELRSFKQKFVLFAKDSSDKYPICNPKYDHFFNWTWTYKKDSEITIKFFTIYNMDGDIIADKEKTKWIPKMDPIDDSVKKLLSNKHKAAAWFVDDCNTISKREVFADNLKRELTKFNLTIDVYGKCGGMNCKRKSMAACYWRLKRNYYFYLAFEDSFSKDYVTESVLHALKNYAVPVVYGGAKYSNVLPPGSYINGLEMGEEKLAESMHQAIINKETYYDFFRWKMYYAVKEIKTAIDPCELCRKLNSQDWLHFQMSYPEFREWWNPDYKQRCNDISIFR